MTNPTVQANNLQKILNDNDIILDVRTDMEHADKQIQIKHVHIPLDQLSPTEFIQHHKIQHDDIIYLLCHAGKRAERAAQKFIESGHPNVKVIEGGIVSCEECGMVHQKPDGWARLCPLSLERQVRITAGIFVALGAALGLLINSLYTFIPLLAGCGLIFAGLTGHCGLALLLAKAPWNKTNITTSA